MRVRGRWAAVVAVMAAAAALALPAAAPAQAVDAAEGTASGEFLTGWFPYWQGDAALDRVLAHTGSDAIVGEIMPFWLYSSYSSTRSAPVCVHDGSDSVAAECARTAPTASQQAQAARMKAAGLTVMPSITDGGSKGALAGAMAKPATRTSLVKGLTGFIVRNGFHGIDLDYEGFAFRDGRASFAKTRPAWIAFVRELSAALHAQGKLLSVTVPGDNPDADSGNYSVYAWSEIIASVDRLRIMTYDLHFDSAGPIGPADWVDRMAVGALAQIGAGNARKLWLGIAAYGYDWITSSTAACRGGSTKAGKREGGPATLKARYRTMVTAGRVVSPLAWDATAGEYTYSYREPDTAQAAGCSHTRTVWFQDGRSHERRAMIAARHHIAGVAMWAFGQEESSTWTKLEKAAPLIAPVKPVLRVSAPRSVVAGTAAGVRVSVRKPDGTPLAGVPVTLQWKPASGTWRTVQTADSGADGVAAFAPVPTRTGSWQAVAAAAVGRRGATSAATTTAVRPVVSVAASTVLPRSVTRALGVRATATGVSASVRRGTITRATGRVAPFRAGQAVTLARRTATGTWVAVASAKVGTTGRYLFSLPTSAPGTTQYRVSTRWTRDFAPGYSLVLTLRVR